MAAKLARLEGNALAEVPHAKEFCAFLPSHTLTLAGIVSKRPYKRDVQIKGFVFERYLMYLDYVVTYDPERNGKVLKYEDLTYSIVEVESVSKAENGNTVLRFGKQYTLASNEWQTLRSQNYDFAKVGIQLKTNESIPGFREYAEEELRTIQ